MDGERAPSGALPLHTLLPALLIFLLGDPHLLESALGRGGDIGGQGSPGEREKRLPTLLPRRLDPSEPPPLKPTALPQPPTCPIFLSPPSYSEGECPLHIVQSTIHSFNKYLLSTSLPGAQGCSRAGRWSLQPQASQPAPQHSTSLLHQIPYHSIRPSKHAKSPSFPRKIFPPPSPPFRHHLTSGY